MTRIGAFGLGVAALLAAMQRRVRAELSDPDGAGSWCRSPPAASPTGWRASWPTSSSTMWKQQVIVENRPGLPGTAERRDRAPRTATR